MASPSSALFVAAFLAVLSGHVAAARTNLTAGIPMTPPSYITSPSGVFAFGFRALDRSSPGKFLLATWFRSGSDDDGRPSGSSQLQSVVWFSRQSSTYSSAVLATAQSALSVTADGQLALADTADGGNRVLWRAPIPSLKRGSVLALLDSGDLQFLGDGGGGPENVLWASFGYPTDTLLPGQSLTMDTRSEGKIISRRADTEFTTGRFTMGVQTDGNVVLYVDLLSGNSPDNAYWQAKTDSSSGNTTVTFDDQGGLSSTLYNGVVQNLISPVATGSAGKFYRFARMDPDGVVRAYARARNVPDGGGNTSWSVSGAFPSDACNKRTSGLQGVCGPGSYCTEQKDRLRCVCPDGYTYADAQHTDSGCTPEFAPQSCDGENNAEEYTLVDLPNTTWETSIYYKKFTSVTEDQCRAYCLNDCCCAAALVIGGTDCAEVAALTNGRQASDVTTKALIKVRRSNNPPARMSARTRTIVAVAVCVAVVLLAVPGGFLARHYLTKKNRESQDLLSVRAFSWKELHKATNGFEKLLGKGSFGEVYQGELKSPRRRLIAVKRLINSNDYSEREFTNEVQSIGQIHHRNLVRMIGYCKEGKHRMLVLEYMPGGSLRGYLHDGCVSPIMHCDIKPDNILLDDTHAPKITDFGISKLLGNQQVHTTVTNIRGTRGYIAPEWFRSDARIDTKVDVYSFGVVLLEMICCRKCQDPLVDQGGDETVTLFGWAIQLVSNQRTKLILPDDDDAAADLERVERFARVAFWCIEPNPSLRPTMHHVVQMLESAVAEAEVLPDPPSCYMDSAPLIVSSV
ncbi:unnamed protein product [Triticum turgidum subsp. durum]|uniref:Receptor-like serine/threonine-protein kinase n=1 Tax=Triticum turgidum subsp. durum TaxID=4567 RepID=A0A9R0ZKN9_TRITD|nr:unnamed protein product [Triticum turgidum subsp. durum]